MDYEIQADKARSALDSMMSNGIPQTELDDMPTPESVAADMSLAELFDYTDPEDMVETMPEPLRTQARLHFEAMVAEGIRENRRARS